MDLSLLIQEPSWKYNFLESFQDFRINPTFLNTAVLRCGRLLNYGSRPHEANIYFILSYLIISGSLEGARWGRDHVWENQEPSLPQDS